MRSKSAPSGYFQAYLDITCSRVKVYSWECVPSIFLPLKQFSGSRSILDQKTFLTVLNLPGSAGEVESVCVYMLRRLKAIALDQNVHHNGIEQKHLKYLVEPQIARLQAPSGSIAGDHLTAIAFTSQRSLFLPMRHSSSSIATTTLLCNPGHAVTVFSSEALPSA